MFKRFLILYLLLAFGPFALARTTVVDDDAPLKPETEEAAESQYNGYWVSSDKASYSDVVWRLYVYDTIFPMNGFNKDPEWLLGGLDPKGDYYVFIRINQLYNSLTVLPKVGESILVHGRLMHQGLYPLYHQSARRDVNAVEMTPLKAVVVPVTAQVMDADSAFHLGYNYEMGYGQKEDYAKAAKYYAIAAKQGHARAQNNLGWLYLNGRYVPKDPTKAVELFRQSAAQEDDLGEINLGNCYMEGTGVIQDYREALKWYLKASDRLNADAQNNVGWSYLNGLGTSKDYSKALAYFKKGSDNGNMGARDNLGWLYEKGLGVPQDYTKAMEWYQAAALGGLAQGDNNVGLLYENGLGVPVNDMEAFNWFQKAVDLGNDWAKKHIEGLKIKIVNKK